jgi:hypothetical protein
MKQMSTDSSKSSADRSTLSNILTTESAIKTSNVPVISTSKMTYPSSDYTTSDDHISSFSNDKIVTTDNKLTGKYISR